MHRRITYLPTDPRVDDQSREDWAYSLGHKNDLATSDDVMPYTPNNDTVYSGAALDVSEEPVILSLPDIDERYWSVQVATR